MKILIFLSNIAVLFNVGESFSKYGRTCNDIGCGSNEICVMAEDPCSYNSGDQCGRYPTCRKTSSHGPSCTRYVCPPTTICKLDGDTPKCVDDVNAHTPDNPKSHNNVATYNENALGSDSDQPVYPVLPGQTTPRPARRRPGSSGGGGGGYEGGSRGSGYPGQPQGSGNSGGYPRQGSPNQGGGYSGYGGGYYNQGGYSRPGYNQGGYSQPGYNQGGYSQPGYNQGGYSQPGYNNQGGGGYYSQNNNRYGQKASSGSDSNPLLDSITGGLKTLGTNFLKNALGKIKL